MQGSAATVCLLLLVLTASGCSPSPKTEAKLSEGGWLETAPDDATRLQMIQQQFRGFDVAMWEVGERFDRLTVSVERGNSELAVYHWEKIRTAIENGIERRPARAKNAQALFLGDTWGEVRADLASKDPARAREALETARTACRSCHDAEGVPYMNDQAGLEPGVRPDLAR